MKNIWAILLRELKAYFVSPIAYIFVAVFLVVTGFFFFSMITWFDFQCRTYMQYPQAMNELNINEGVIRPLFHNMAVVFLMVVPFLTMRLFADERRSGTDELLLTSPISMDQIILGKFLGASLTMLSLLAIVPIHAAILSLASTPDWGAAAVGLLGMVLIGLFMVALGVLISSLSQSQIEAGVLTLGVLLLLGLGPSVAESVSPGLARGLGFIAVLGRFEDFTRGVIDLRHVVFFLGSILLMLALALRSIDLLRWRGV